MLISITPRKTKILYKLFTIKIPIGTIKSIAKVLDGTNWSSETYNFLNDCVRLSILVFENEEWVNGKSYPTYRIDTEALKNFWKNRIEYKLSFEIVNDEHAIVF